MKRNRGPCRKRKFHDSGAIETRYHGCFFRSRLEARWAVFLDSVKEPWEYEFQGYSLPSGRYLPDFWLPRLRLWLEIKGPEPTRLELTLCEELSRRTRRQVLIAWGSPKPFGSIFLFAQAAWHLNSVLVFDRTRRLAIVLTNTPHVLGPEYRPITTNHFDAATSARFEFER